MVDPVPRPCTGLYKEMQIQEAGYVGPQVFMESVECECGAECGAVAAKLTDIYEVLLQ